MSQHFLPSHFSDGEGVKEVFVGKRQEVVPIDKYLQDDLEANLGITGITDISVHQHYVVDGIEGEDFNDSVHDIFAEAPVDTVSTKSEFIAQTIWKKQIVIESQPGQYDDAVAAIQSSLILKDGKTHNVRVRNVISLNPEVSDKDIARIKEYLINPNEKREVLLDDKKFERKIQNPDNHVILEGFTQMNSQDFPQFISTHELAMNQDDLAMVHEYFKNEEQRDPTKVEILLIDTYWSDHCRHTTFFTEIEDVDFGGDTELVEDIRRTHQDLKKRTQAYNEKHGKNKGGDTLMEVAQASARFLQDDPAFKGTEFMDISDEDNAASYKTVIELEDGTTEEWVIMFKNETHNSPTEAEPFGGAATCLGGAMRDTQSGRAYNFAAMRVSGSANPTEPIDATTAGKVSQRAISIMSMLGYSSYGNQVGLATGRVREFFHPGYRAKRFECGYVVAAVKERNLVRKKPESGDVVIMFGGLTGNDGYGGAKISSEGAGTVDKDALGAHVQKGNPLEKRKIQRLMLNPKFTRMIKKSNDFGAGGVSVALGELSRGINIDLDTIGKNVKYAGMSDDQLMLSESQERMSIIVSKENYEKALEFIRSENLHAFQAGVITDKGNPEEDRLAVDYQGKNPVSLSRSFLDRNGATRKTNAKVVMEKTDFFSIPDDIKGFLDAEDYKGALLHQLGKLQNASQKGLGGNFDNSVGGGTDIAPYGGKYQSSPQIAMAQRVPTFEGTRSLTSILSTFAFNPELLSNNTYLGGMYAIIEAVSKIVAVGGDHEKTWMSLQEYFGKLSTDEKWGEVYAGLLGTMKALLELKIAAIGGKDSMSGTNKDPETGEITNVPPTIVGFANCPIESQQIISAELKHAGNKILHFPIPKDQKGIPDFIAYRGMIRLVQDLISEKKVFSSTVVESGGLVTALTNMSLGNKVGFSIDAQNDIFTEAPGDILVEVSPEVAKDFSSCVIGDTLEEHIICIGDNVIEGEDAEKTLDGTFEGLWPAAHENTSDFMSENVTAQVQRTKLESGALTFSGQPKALIPAFPGTNSDVDTQIALEESKFDADVFVFDTQNEESFRKSRIAFAELLKEQSLLVFPGGFSNGDQPDGSAKFIALVMKSPEVREALQEFLDRKDTMTVGICNGFQALIKLGVFEKGDIKDELDVEDETLVLNHTTRHETELVRVKVENILSPATEGMETGDDYLIPISHGEGRVYISKARYEQYKKNGQIAFTYLDEDGQPTNKYNGSAYGIAGLTSPDGRIVGLMPHPERIREGLYQNVPGNKDMPMFEGIYNSIIDSGRGKGYVGSRRT